MTPKYVLTVNNTSIRLSKGSNIIPYYITTV